MFRYNHTNNYLAAIFTCFVLSCATLPMLFDDEFQAAEFALGQETRTVLNSVDGRTVHCSSTSDIQDCLQDFASVRQEKKMLLWLGNSQLHAINQYSEGDKTAVELLHRRLLSKGAYVIGMSYPNISLLQTYIGYEFVANRYDLDTLILPLVFDDTRENGLGPDFQSVFDEAEFLRKISNTDFGKFIVQNFIDNRKDNEKSDISGLSGSVQALVESKLNSFLEKNWSVWRDRASYRSQIFGKLYLFRNWIFNISPSTVRRKIPTAYEVNLKALGALLTRAKEKSLRVLLYIPPIRNDYPIPYDLAEYEDFKRDVNKIARANGFAVKTFENSVPNFLWGSKNSTSLGGGLEVDFMHFQAGGHQILSELVYELMESNSKNAF